MFLSFMLMKLNLFLEELFLKKNNRRLLCFLTFMENCLAVSFLGG